MLELRRELGDKFEHFQNLDKQGSGQCWRSDSMRGVLPN